MACIHLWKLNVCIILISLLSGCLINTTQPSPTPDPTITPLPITAVATPVPTSTSIPRVPNIDILPDTIAAQQHLERKEFPQALSLLRRVDAAYPDNSQVKLLLADAYLQWGLDTIATSDGNLEKIATAFDYFSSGLVVAPSDSSVHADLQTETDLAGGLLNVARDLATLKAVDPQQIDSAGFRQMADQLRDQVTRLSQQRANYPGLRDLHILVLVAVAEAYEQIAGQGAEGISLLTQARGYCKEALALNDQHAAAQECQQRLTNSIVARQPTATLPPRPPTSTPEPVVVIPPRPTSLSVWLHNRDERPGCISLTISDASTYGWTLTIDGLNMGGTFDGRGNVAVCGLPDHAVTFTIRNANGIPLSGGSGIPAAGRDIFLGNAQY